MKVKTGMRAGVSAQEVWQGVENSAGRAAQSVGGAAQNVGTAAQDAVRSVQRWWTRSGVGDTVSKAFWFPLDPPR
jgi:hypothetical protein